MSDESYFTPSTGPDAITTVVTRLEEGLSDARKLTPVVVTDAESPYTITPTVDLIYIQSTTAVSVLLPTAPSDGDTYEIMAANVTGTVTVDRNGNAINTVGANDTITVAFTDVKKYTWVAADNTWFRR